MLLPWVVDVDGVVSHVPEAGAGINEENFGGVQTHAGIGRSNNGTNTSMGSMGTTTWSNLLSMGTMTL